MQLHSMLDTAIAVADNGHAFHIFVELFCPQNKSVVSPTATVLLYRSLIRRCPVGRSDVRVENVYLV